MEKGAPAVGTRKSVVLNFNTSPLWFLGGRGGGLLSLCPLPHPLPQSAVPLSQGPEVSLLNVEQRLHFLSVFRALSLLLLLPDFLFPDWFLHKMTGDHGDS